MAEHPDTVSRVTVIIRTLRAKRLPAKSICDFRKSQVIHGSSLV
jgi:hypothetical protein